MIADFKINDDGDLILEGSEESKSLICISFHISKHKGQKITFFLDTELEPSISGRVKISFNLNNNTTKYGSKVIKSTDSISQLIKIKLKTSLGELSERAEFGSTLRKHIHSNLTDKSLAAIQSTIESDVKEYIHNPIVRITPVVEKRNSYRQYLQVEIYDKDILMFKNKI